MWLLIHVQNPINEHISNVITFAFVLYFCLYKKHDQNRHQIASNCLLFEIQMLITDKRRFKFLQCHGQYQQNNTAKGKFYQIIVAKWHHKVWVSNGSSNGLLPGGAKPSPEPVLTYHQWSPSVYKGDFTVIVLDTTHYKVFESYIFENTGTSPTAANGLTSNWHCA